MLIVCKRAKKEKNAKIKELSKEKISKWEENELFAHIIFTFEGCFSKDSSKEKSSWNKEKNHWKNDLDNFPAYRSSWFNTRNTLYTKEKLIKILTGDVSLPN